MTNCAVNVHNAKGTHPIVLVCEHASALIPPSFNQLGLSAEDAKSHIAWDPGALLMARYLSSALNAVLVEGTVSRLIYDLNRPPEAASAIAQCSEDRTVPGNVDLSDAEIKHRIATYYEPFKRALSNVLSQHPVTPVIVTIHSFTPVYKGKKRSVEIGILHDEDARLADAILGCASGFNIKRNSPYGPEDGVTHTLQLHALPNGLLNVMVEVSNTLITTNEQCAAMAQALQAWLLDALTLLEPNSSSRARP